MAASADRGVELKRHLDEAFRAFEAGQDERARRLCRQALAIDPDNTTAHSLMGLLYEREGRAVEAAGEFEHVVEVNPESEAERQTLRRLRGEERPDTEPVFLDEEDEDEARRRIYTHAGIGALVVAMTVLFGFVVWGKMHNGARTATASVLKDLELAQQAFERGRYEDAMESAQRVLAVQPDNALAKQIYDRAKAHLTGGRVATAPRGGADYGAAPPPTVAPALPPAVTPPAAPVTGAPQGAPQPQPNPAYQVAFGGGIPSPAVGTVPPAPVGGYAGQPPSAANQWPQLGATGRAATLSGQMNHASMYPPRPPVGPFGAKSDRTNPDVRTRPDPPQTARTPGQENLGGGGNIRVEVNRSGSPTSPGTTGAEVAPRTDTETAPRAGTAVDPAVQAEAERQLKMRQMRERGGR
ncbi:MAG: tetratricopeptide repeat protein [Armatimonadetes bacterium]|nr:tetratricopeptide repeat protein [Armatimonadota bacterium]